MNPSIRLTSPSILNDNSFEYLVTALPQHEHIGGKQIIIDLSLIESIDAYGLLGLVIIGSYLRKNNCSTAITLPRQKDALAFMYQAGFCSYLPGLFNEGSPVFSEPLPQESPFLLGITPIDKSLDIHDIAITVRESFRHRFPTETPDLWNNHIVIISEICQNIPEHSKDSGFVAITCTHDTYKRPIMHIVIMDTGIGIRTSLNDRFQSVFREKWSDHMALHKTLFEGVSRFNDPGRGNGIVRSKELVNKLNGKMSIRSGTAKLWGKIPSWEIERFFRKSLTYLPGTQINIQLPVPIENS